MESLASKIQLMCRLIIARLINSDVDVDVDRTLARPQVFLLLTVQNWYCSLPGHDYFCEVHEDFIEDDFNLTGETARLLIIGPTVADDRLAKYGAVLEGGVGDGLGC
jgi:hypothetical protein